jgi:hypothetical protein
MAIPRCVVTFGLSVPLHCWHHTVMITAAFQWVLKSGVVRSLTSLSFRTPAIPHESQGQVVTLGLDQHPSEGRVLPRDFFALCLLLSVKF